MTITHRETAILIQGRPGQPSCQELEREAAAGESPRTDYVELARALDADVIDSHYMARRAAPLAHFVSSRLGMHHGQVAEAFLRRGRYRRMLVWHDRLGLELASLYKLTRARGELVLLSAYIGSPKRAGFIRCFRVDTHLRTIISESSEQMRIAAERLQISPHKLRMFLHGVDELFWRPHGGPEENMICAIGSESRDYPTLIQAIEGLDLKVGIVSGGISKLSLPGNVEARVGLSWLDLRDLYSRARFVVLPTLDVEYNAGITALKEAMAMGKAVVLTRSRGQTDYMQAGVHGLYVPPGDPQALREAIQYLADHPEETERMGRAARAFIEENYTLDAAVSRLAALVRGADTPDSSPAVGDTAQR